MDSLIIEGQQNAVEFFCDADGKPVPVKGHRRISAMRLLAKEHAPGFMEDMPIRAEEVLGATVQDLLCRSVSDNLVRKDLSMGERIRAAKTLHQGRVEANRAAAALGYSPKQYLRDLRLALQPWILEQIDAGNVGHTAAGVLLEAAEKADRVDALKRHVEGWVDARIREIAASGKEKKVSSLLTKTLVEHWVSRLRAGEPLDDRAALPPDFRVDIDAEANRITVGGKVDLLRTPLNHLDRYGKALQEVLTVLSGYRAKRGAVEGPDGPQDLARKAAEEVRRLTADPGAGEGAAELESDALDGA